VAMKVAAPLWQHRADLGGVRLDLTNPADMKRSYEDLQRSFGPDVEVIVQRMAPGGVACVVEIVDDPAFGPVVGFGLGGIVADLFGDLAWRPAPLTDRDAEELVRAPRALPLLTGYGGAPPADLDALADVLQRIGRLADQHPEVARLRLQPVLAHATGTSVLQATVHIRPRRARPDTGPRRLT
jgi:ATP-grasp domain